MIDRLPDDIVVTILSGLKLNDAARAVTIISPKWYHILPNLTSLDFVVSHPVEPHECSDRYATWVSKVLDLHRASFINEFRVCFKLGAAHTANINEWINIAISKRVKVLELDFTCLDVKCLNNHPYTLTFHYFERISSNDSIHFLKSLCLKRVNISGELLELLLSRSYSLEDLVIERSNALNYVKLNNSGRSLKHLMITYCKNLKRLEIDVGDVASFKLECVPHDHRISAYVSSFSPIDVPGVDKLELEFVPPDICTVVEPSNLVCDGFSSLKNLCFKSMRIPRNLLESIMSGSQCLEQLILEDTCTFGPWHIYLINNSYPNLKYLAVRGRDFVGSVEIDIENVSSLRYLYDKDDASLSNLSSLDDATTCIKIICSPIKKAELKLKSGRPLKFTAYGLVEDLELVRSTCMNSLTSIYLNNVNVGGAELESLLSKYPLVKELTVMNSNDLVTLNVRETLSYLKHLEINDCINLNELTVQAPNLRSFAFGYNGIDNQKVIYGSLTSLVDVFLSEKSIGHLLPRLNMIRCFSSQLSKLSLCLEKMPSRDPVIPTFNNVTYLELTVDELDCKSILPLRCFAEACPSLRELTVKIFRHCICYLTLGSDSEQECNEDGDSYTGQSTTTSEECTLEDVEQWFENVEDGDDLINKRNTLPELREFKFFGAFHYPYHIDDEISFVLHIVKYAQNLKKVLFNTIIAEDCNVLKMRQKKTIENLAKVMPSRVAMEILGSEKCYN